MADFFQEFFVNPILLNGWFNTQPFEASAFIQRLWSENPCNCGGNWNG